jgi:hypothetical protein
MLANCIERNKMADCRITNNHAVIRSWAEERSAIPCVVAQTDIIRLNFNPGKPHPTLVEITWDEFFRLFEERGLSFLYQHATATGKFSNFNKFIKRQEVAP